MDYTNPAYFAGAGTQPPYHFIGIPPLTPSHSNSAASDDFNASPQVSSMLLIQMELEERSG